MLLPPPPPPPLPPPPLQPGLSYGNLAHSYSHPYQVNNALSLPSYAFQQSPGLPRLRSATQDNEANHSAHHLQDDAQAGLHALSAMTLLNRRYRAIAQPALFKAPVLGIGRRGHWNEKSPVYLFARALVEQPAFSKYTTSLRFDLPSCWGGSIDTNTPDRSEVHRMAVAVSDKIDSIEWMNRNAKTGWKWQLQHLRPLPFYAVILSLLPNLRRLNVVVSDRTISHHPFEEIFWMTSAKSIDLRALVKCPGLVNLRHFKTSSWTTPFQRPLSELTFLTSLDITVRNQIDVKFAFRALPQIKHLRVGCGMNELLDPHISCELYTFLYQFTLMLRFLPSLETLEFYAADQPGGCMKKPAAKGSLARLLEHCGSVAGTLKTLETPRGWWTWPNGGLVLKMEDSQVCSRVDDDSVQPGAYTGCVTDFRAFTAIETLVTHSTAIIAKGAWDTEVADPTRTLPSSLKHITVYGAHDELWSWVWNVLECRRTHLPFLQEITLLKEEPVHRKLRLSNLAELRESHGSLSERIVKSSVVVSGHF